MCISFSLLNQRFLTLLRVLIKPVDQSGLLVSDTRPPHDAIECVKLLVRGKNLTLTDLIHAIVQLSLKFQVVLHTWMAL